MVSGVGRDTKYRLRFARELGFETNNVTEGDLERARNERTDGIGYDLVFD